MDNLESRLEKIAINDITLINGSDGDKWGLPLKDLYRLGLSFFKGKHFFFQLMFFIRM